MKRRRWLRRFWRWFAHRDLLVPRDFRDEFDHTWNDYTRRHGL